MAAVGSKRKSANLELERVLKKLNLLDSRLNNLALGQIQLFKVCVNLVGKIDGLKGSASGNSAAESKKLVLRTFFTKQTHCHQLTRLQINVVMLTNSPFPHDVEFNELFIELRGDHEKKGVMSWWHSNRDRIVKYFFCISYFLYFHNFYRSFRDKRTAVVRMLWDSLAVKLGVAQVPRGGGDAAVLEWRQMVKPTWKLFCTKVPQGAEYNPDFSDVVLEVYKRLTRELSELKAYEFECDVPTVQFEAWCLLTLMATFYTPAASLTEANSWGASSLKAMEMVDKQREFFQQ